MIKNLNFALGGFGGGGFLFSLIAWLFEVKDIINIVTEFPKAIIVIIGIMVSIIAAIVTFLVKIHNEKNEITKQLSAKNKEVDEITKQLSAKNKEVDETTKQLSAKNKEFDEITKQLQKIKPAESIESLYDKGREWTHTILVVDDDNYTRKIIKEELQGYDVVAIERIDDYRLASEFEIIISDIFDCSPGRAASSVLNTIIQKYPYKYIIPISAEPGASEGLNVGVEIIQKDGNFRYINTLLNRVHFLANELDDANKHWKTVETTLKSNNISVNQLEAIKSNYYRFINRKQH